jgi:hypothetical protein
MAIINIITVTICLICTEPELRIQCEYKLLFHKSKYMHHKLCIYNSDETCLMPHKHKMYYASCSTVVPITPKKPP